MRLFFAASLIALAAACSPKKDADSQKPAAPAEVGASADPAAPELSERLAAMRAQFARVDMAPDVAFLSADDRKVVNLLIDAADLMSKIYLLQVSEDNPATRAAIAASAAP